MERHSGIFCIVFPFNLVYSQNLSKNTFYLYLSSILISKMPHHSGNLSEIQERPSYSSHQIIFYFYPLQLFQQWLCSNPQKNKCRTGMNKIYRNTLNIDCKQSFPCKIIHTHKEGRRIHDSSINEHRHKESIYTKAEPFGRKQSYSVKDS